MARKVTVQRSNTISTWKTKTQTMSNYIGDLDDLGPVFDSNSFFPPPDTRQDSSLVAALNSLGNPIDEIHELFFEAKRVMPKPVTANFHVDSGRFRNIFRTDRLWNYDSAMPGPNFNQNDKPYWLGDSPGTNAYDFVCDSAHINNLHLDYLDNDSALVYDKATITNAYINKFSIDPDETGSSVQVDRVREFRIENQSNVTRFGAQLMDDSVMDTNPANFGLN
tara:strand:- start:519 stop:1184 length:666 start_codon:yes stop_codon:yes gene_type:complete